jgi:hypothetical protein
MSAAREPRGPVASVGDEGQLLGAIIPASPPPLAEPVTFGDGGQLFSAIAQVAPQAWSAQAPRVFS